MEVLILLVLVLLNGVFAMSEIALVTARRPRLAAAAEEGDAAARAALRLHDDPTRLLSTVQIGITSIGILNGVVGASVLAAPLAAWMTSVGLSQETSHYAATGLVVASITYVSIVVGELVPKRLGQFDPEGVARLVARPMQVLSLAATPFVKLLSLSTDTLLRLFPMKQRNDQAVTEEEIEAVLAEGSEAGVIEKNEHAMVRNVFRLDDRQIASLMIPRADIVYLDVAMPMQQNLDTVSTSRHSRFPVCRGGLDEVLGVVSAKQLLRQALNGNVDDLTADLQQAVFVPETLTGLDLLEHFRVSGAQMVLVVDEYGDVKGVVTLKDLLEALTGEFKAVDQAEAWATQRPDGSWLLDGLIPLSELKDRLEIRNLPEDDKGHYHTLSGLVMWLSGRLPKTGDVVTWRDWRLEVVDVDGRRLDKVLATRAPAATTATHDHQHATSAH
jgi:magnesium and cobalt exporter, CNNM family